MKTKLLLIAVLGIAVTGAFAAAPAVSPATSVQVTFNEPGKFSDVKEDYYGSDRGRENILDELKNHIVSRAAKLLGSGQRLEITVTDVDLAGDFEPWRGAEYQDVRIVKDIYPPRINLEFRLYGADGKVLSEGKRQLQDLSFMMNIVGPASDPLRYDKEMLNTWLYQEFKK